MGPFGPNPMRAGMARTLSEPMARYAVDVSCVRDGGEWGGGYTVRSCCVCVVRWWGVDGAWSEWSGVDGGGTGHACVIPVVVTIMTLSPGNGVYIFCTILVYVGKIISKLGSRWKLQSPKIRVSGVILLVYHSARTVWGSLQCFIVLPDLVCAFRTYPPRYRNHSLRPQHHVWSVKLQPRARNTSFPCEVVIRLNRRSRWCFPHRAITVILHEEPPWLLETLGPGRRCSPHSDRRGQDRPRPLPAG